eukprot:SAG11_NODE_1642_length_4529_cov_2.274944_2_plen_133_part_00
MRDTLTRNFGVGLFTQKVEDGIPLPPSVPIRVCSLRDLAGAMTLAQGIYDMIQMTLLLYTLAVVPMRIAFAIQLEPTDAGFWIDAAIDMFFMADLIIQSRTFYKSGRSGQWVSNGKKNSTCVRIKRHYNPFA